MKIRFEERLAEGQRRFGIGRIKPVREPRLFAALDDEGAQLGIEAISVHREPPVLGTLEDERKCVQRQGRPEPDEAADTPVELRFEIACVGGAHATIDSVRTDEQVALLTQRGDVLHLALKLELDTQLRGAALQDLEQPLARDTAEAVAARAQRL